MPQALQAQTSHLAQRESRLGEWAARLRRQAVVLGQAVAFDPSEVEEMPSPREETDEGNEHTTLPRHERNTRTDVPQQLFSGDDMAEVCLVTVVQMQCTTTHLTPCPFLVLVSPQDVAVKIIDMLARVKTAREAGTRTIQSVRRVVSALPPSASHATTRLSPRPDTVHVFCIETLCGWLPVESPY